MVNDFFAKRNALKFKTEQKKLQKCKPLSVVVMPFSYTVTFAAIPFEDTNLKSKHELQAQ